MPDYQNFKIEKLANIRINVANSPQYRISLTVNDSNSGEELRNYTGANAILFPDILLSLSDSDQQELIELITNWLINKRMEGKV